MKQHIRWFAALVLGVALSPSTTRAFAGRPPYPVVADAAAEGLVVVRGGALPTGCIGLALSPDWVLTLDQVYIEGVAQSCLGDPQRAGATAIESGAASVPVALVVMGERTMTHSGGVAFTLLRTESPLPRGVLRTFAPEPRLATPQERTQSVRLDFLGRTAAQTFVRATLLALPLGKDGHHAMDSTNVTGFSDVDAAAPVVMADGTLVGLLGEMATRSGQSAARSGSVVSVHRQMPWVSHVMAGSLDRQRSQLAPFPAATDISPSAAVEPLVAVPRIENARPGTPEFDRYVREQEEQRRLAAQRLAEQRAALAAGPTEVLTNGSFEMAGTNEGPVRSLPGWTLRSGATINVINVAAGAPDGTRYIQLDDPSASAASTVTPLPDVLTTRVTTLPNVMYELTLSVSPVPGTPAERNTMEIWFDGRRVATLAIDGRNLTAPRWFRVVLPVKARRTEGVLEIREWWTPQGQGMLLDAVSLQTSTRQPTRDVSAWGRQMPGLTNGGFELPAIPAGTYRLTPRTIQGWNVDLANVAPAPRQDCNSGSSLQRALCRSQQESQLRAWEARISIEVQHRVAGSPWEGNQFVELDGNAPVRIRAWPPQPPAPLLDEQRRAFDEATAMTAGSPIVVSAAFSPRPGTALDNNRAELWHGGQLIARLEADGRGLADTCWLRLEADLVVDDPHVYVELRDIGTADGMGTYFDGIVRRIGQ